MMLVESESQGCQQGLEACGQGREARGAARWRQRVKGGERGEGASGARASRPGGQGGARGVRGKGKERAPVPGPSWVLPTSELWEAGERPGSACATEVEGLRRRPPTAGGGLGLGFKV